MTFSFKGNNSKNLVRKKVTFSYFLRCNRSVLSRPVPSLLNSSLNRIQISTPVLILRLISSSFPTICLGEVCGKPGLSKYLLYIRTALSKYLVLAYNVIPFKDVNFIYRQESCSMTSPRGKERSIPNSKTYSGQNSCQVRMFESVM